MTKRFEPMSRQLAPLTLCIGALCVTAVPLGATQQAEAAINKAPASWCRPASNGYSADLDYDGRAYLPNGSNDAAWITCPFYERDTFRHNAVTSLTVYVRDGSDVNVVRAEACRFELDLDFMDCGNPEDTDLVGVGYTPLTPSLSEWQGAVDGVAFVQIFLPTPTAGDGQSWFTGFSAQN